GRCCHRSALWRHRPRLGHHPQACAHDGRRRDGGERAGQRFGVHRAPAGRYRTLTSASTTLLACHLTSFRKKYIIHTVAFPEGPFPVKSPRAPPNPSPTVKRTVTPPRPPNADLREREYLTPKEVDRLQDAARKHSRYGHRDATAILIAYRHGLRASELCE